MARRRSGSAVWSWQGWRSWSGLARKRCEPDNLGKSNLRLIDGDALVDLILAHYEAFDSRYKGTLPLKRVYVPEAVLGSGE